MLNGRLRQALSKTEVQHRARANTKTRKTHAVTFWNIKKRDSRKSFTRHVTVTPGNTSNPPSAIPDKAQTQPQDPESDSIPGKKKKKKPKETSSVLGRNEQMLYGVTKSRPGRPAESHSRNHALHLVCSVRFIPDQGMERDMDNWTYMDRSCASLHDLSNFNPIAIIR